MNTLGGLHLRRETQALALPPQTTHIVVVELTPAEKQLYDHVCERAAARAGAATAKALVLVGALQKLCVHASLLNSGAEKLSADRVFRPWPERPDRVLELSGKLQAAAVILTHILTRTRGKVVVASSFKMPLVIIANWIRSRTSVRVAGVAARATGPPRRRSRWSAPRFCVWHTGEQSAATRSANRRSLNELDARCMLATVQNLEGVTLIGANFMMLLNPSWNPAQDEQAAMRIHRIGQSRACTVIRLVGRGTIEETIVGRQAEKDGLCAILTQGGFPPPTSPDRTEIFSRSESPSRLHDRGGGDFDELGEDSDDDLAAAGSAGRAVPEHHDPSRWSARAASEIPREGRASWLGDLLDAKLRIRETLALSGAAAEGSDGDDDDDDAMVSEDAPLVTTAANTPLVSFVFTADGRPARAEFLARARREADAARPVLVEDEDGAVAELEGATEGPSIESELDVRRRAADFQDVHHDLRAAIRLAVREASARTTADDERDVLGDGAQTLEHLAVMT
ncbi:hypothetical protein JL720_11855 [Aureococcus anophagefferens]|nr:hypothetical protein JL720_11855 [Aureococcus anophagefferens]